ncbi:uncharacterized protein BDZ83DRAFT_610607 [Colletotrichum acutatum]|uniref:Uncharacterized protein n=1 Tax=Glomerella acutata TaxID=27357 RepID=A0AAD8USV4_GLOAC|nr:uncharacterized protein BDZ83DRAFT_610607 [Colletotrichum acutatum]KAK1728197.1 hypothetical protein BDZ83DRAFT_610607 [Colletotrichum acutatum]
MHDPRTMLATYMLACTSIALSHLHSVRRTSCTNQHRTPIQTLELIPEVARIVQRFLHLGRVRRNRID